jgi:acyl carrier protein
MSEELEQRVRQLVASVLPRPDLAYTVELDSPLRGIGFDSLAFMELIANLEVAFDVRMLEEDLDQYSFRTTSEIMHYVAAKNGFNSETASPETEDSPDADSVRSSPAGC